MPRAKCGKSTERTVDFYLTGYKFASLRVETPLNLESQCPGDEHSALVLLGGPLSPDGRSSLRAPVPSAAGQGIAGSARRFRRPAVTGLANVRWCGWGRFAV